MRRKPLEAANAARDVSDDDRAEEVEEPAAEGSVSWPTWKKHEEPPEHVIKAWELVCQGYDNWRQIARALGFDPLQAAKKIKRDVCRYSKQVASAIDDPEGLDARAEALTKYQRQEKELWKLYEQAKGQVDVQRNGDVVIQTVHPRSHSLRLKVLRSLSDVTERQAALKGVVTRREAHTNDDAPQTPANFNVTIVARQAVDDDDDEPAVPSATTACSFCGCEEGQFHADGCPALQLGDAPSAAAEE